MRYHINNYGTISYKKSAYKISNPNPRLILKNEKLRTNKLKHYTKILLQIIRLKEGKAINSQRINDKKRHTDMRTKHIQYQTQGTCSQLIDVTADENDIIQQVFFLGGCNGNLQGISQLVRGQSIDAVIDKLRGIRCGTKRTSCPDQLSMALEELKKAPVTTSQ